MNAWRLFGWMWARGTVSGAVLGMLFGTLIAPVFGTIVGLFFGTVLGAVTGIVNGLTLAFMMHFFSHPRNILRCRLYAVVVATICTTVTSLFILLHWGSATFLIYPPTIVAVVTAAYFTWRLPIDEPSKVNLQPANAI